MKSLEEVERRALSHAYREAAEQQEYARHIACWGSQAAGYLKLEVEFPSGVAYVTVDPDGRLSRRRWRRA
jgi:hypothetical protein